ncbi:argininosuccinate synthase [Buchnera aphidicola (Kurisakia onigurumii)]
MKNNMKTVVLAYSGGLDTSVIIPWIKEKYQLEVIAFVANIGQKNQDFSKVKENALKSGAKECIVVDLQEKFVKKYIYPLLQIGSMYENNYLLGTAISRPIIAKTQTEIALKKGAFALCHGATGKGNDQVRFESAYAALAPNLQIIAPWRIWNFNSRQDLLQYIHKKNISIEVTLEKMYSRDENIFHLSTEGGVLENPWNASKPDCWEWINELNNTPDKPEEITLHINQGIITHINEKKVSILQSLSILNKIGSKHGIGRIDIVENRLIGIKSRGCYETPGGTIIYTVLRELEQLVLDKESTKWKKQISLEMAYVIYEGRWFTPIRISLQNAISIYKKLLTGIVVLNLYKGNIIVLKKQSCNSLYSQEYATFEKDKIYNHADASGFIKLFSLSSKIRALYKK